MAKHIYWHPFTSGRHNTNGIGNRTANFSLNCISPTFSDHEIIKVAGFDNIEQYLHLLDQATDRIYILGQGGRGAHYICDGVKEEVHILNVMKKLQNSGLSQTHPKCEIVFHSCYSASNRNGTYGEPMKSLESLSLLGYIAKTLAFDLEKKI